MAFPATLQLALACSLLLKPLSYHNHCTLQSIEYIDAFTAVCLIVREPVNWTIIAELIFSKSLYLKKNDSMDQNLHAT